MIPNIEIDRISSMVDAAIIKVAIPLSSPYPSDFKDNKDGIITAGLTPLKTHLRPNNRSTLLTSWKCEMDRENMYKWYENN